LRLQRSHTARAVWADKILRFTTVVFGETMKLRCLTVSPGVCCAALSLFLGACGGGGGGGESSSSNASSVASKAVSAAAAEPASLAAATAQQKVIRIEGNMVVDRADELLLLVDRARAKGANTVIFSDTKVNLFGTGVALGSVWLPEMRRLVDGVKSRGMKFIFETITLGYCGGILASDTNLATGYPVVDQPLRVTNGALRPLPTANLVNGDFEQSANNVPSGWGFQDAPGERTFIDTATVKSGRASLRADARGGASSRIFTKFSVKPWHQYTVRVWVKTQSLSAGGVYVLVRDATGAQALTSQQLSLPTADGSDRQGFTSANGLSVDWTEMKLAFNSQDKTTVDLGLTVFGGTAGSIWWDDVRIDDTPTMNWLVRSDLPRAAKAADGSALRLGTDLAEPLDPQLGQLGYPGRYGNYHTPSYPAVLNPARLREGDTVLLSGYHTLVTMNAQVGCSWNNPQVIAKMRSVHQALQNEFKPDGYLLNYDEIRTGGFEPADRAFANSGAALAASIQKAYRDLDEVAPGVAHYFWSDMVDPSHNARANFEQVANTLNGSWLTLDSSKVVILTWWERDKINTVGRESLKFFAERRFQQVIGAFYDENVQTNFTSWQEAAKGLPGISGSMYTTYQRDYSQIEAFGDLWWR
jgi:hypothetical protein